MAKVTASEVKELDPYAFLAVLGIGYGAEVVAGILARARSRPAHLRKMAWLWCPRMPRAVPYLGYVLVMARKPELPPQRRAS